MNDQFTNVRFESVDYKTMVGEIKHDLRTNKITSVIKPQTQSHAFIMNEQGELERFDFYMKDERMRAKGKNLVDKLGEVEERHRRLLRINYNQSLNKKRVNSFNMGVLTFSDSMIELAEENLEEVLEMGVKTIKDICEELGIKLHYISFHKDEKGVPHFHYFTDNFNSQGRTINPKRNKNLGQKLQDIGNKYFNALGFKRGISKELTGKKHLSIKDYQDYQDTLKENQELKKEIAEMKELEDNIFENIMELVSQFYEIGMNYKGKSANELLDMFKRYFKDDKKFDKLLDKVVNLADKKGLLDGWEKKGSISFKELQRAIKENRTVLKNKNNIGTKND